LPETDPPGSCLVVTDLTGRRKLASLDHVAAGIARDIRNPLSKMNIFLSALDKICQGSKTLEPKRKEQANELYLKAKSASEKIEEVTRRVMAPPNADTKEGLKIRKKLRPTRGSPG
jgi:hypothetical protein